MKSKRADGRGHWPAGRRRHSPGTEYDRLLDRLRERLDRRVWGKVSCRVLADWCGVSDRTVRRWLSGQHLPEARQTMRISSWLVSVKGS